MSASILQNLVENNKAWSRAELAAELATRRVGSPGFSMTGSPAHLFFCKECSMPWWPLLAEQTGTKSKISGGNGATTLVPMDPATVRGDEYTTMWTMLATFSV